MHPSRAPRISCWPRRGRTNQPRATPWGKTQEPPASPERAQHEGHRGLLRTFRAWGCFVASNLPRALPWADLFGPFGAKNRYNAPGTAPSPTTLVTANAGGIRRMPSPVTRVVQHLRLMLDDGSPGARDGELLQRFALGHDETAFAALLHRHGPLVLAGCRRILH